MPRKTTFVTFSVLGIVYQTLKALSLWQQEPSQQKGEEVWESREVSLSVLCFHFVDHHVLNDLFCEELFVWPSFRLKFGRTRILFPSPPARANLESLCLFRYMWLIPQSPLACMTGGVAENRQSAHPPGLSVATSSAKITGVVSTWQPLGGGTVALEGPRSPLPHLAPAAHRVLVQRLQQELCSFV